MPLRHWPFEQKDMMPECVWLMILFILSSSSSQDVDLKIEWSRPRIVHEDDEYHGFADTHSAYADLHRLVYFDFCDSELAESIDDLTMAWIFFDINTDAIAKLKDEKADYFRKQVFKKGLRPFNTTGKCKISWRAPRESKYKLHLKAHSKDTNMVLASKELIFEVRDIWYVVMGDSVASGEGNPDEEAGLFVVPKWINFICSRSAKSFSFKIYEKITELYPKTGVLFTYLPCSGSSVSKGINRRFRGQPAQLKVIKDIQQYMGVSCCEGCCKTTPDVILLSSGANDIKFARILATTLISLPTSQLNLVPIRLENLDEELTALANDLEEMGVASESVFYLEYFDQMRNQRGDLDSRCVRSGFADQEDFAAAVTQAFKPLNRLIRRKAADNQWTFVGGIADAFSTHGICSSVSWIRSVQESFKKQLTQRGAYHPTNVGHDTITQLAWKVIKVYLENRFGKLSK